MNSQEINVLILDDEAESFAPNLANVTSLEQFTEIEDKLEKRIEPFAEERMDLVFLDSMFEKDKRGWRTFLPRLRDRFPTAHIYLMSELRFSNIDEEFEKDWRNWKDIVALEERIDTDPRISFFPKPPRDESKMQAAPKAQDAPEEASPLTKLIRDIIQKFRDRRDQKKKLTQMVINASLKSYSTLLHTSLRELCRAHFSDRKPVDPPYGFDIAVEEVIRKEFAHRVHEFGLVLATEEEGMQNRVYRKLRDPRFFLFSDPLDGSSALRGFLKPIGDSEEWQDKDLGTFLETKFSQPDLLAAWQENHAGPVDFYSPTLSMTLAETDRVVSSVLINLFTGRMFLSVEAGNYVFNLASRGGKKVLQAVAERSSEAVDVSFEPDGTNMAITARESGREEQGRVLSFSGEPFTFEAKASSPGYILGQLKAKKLLNEAQATVSYEHFSRNIQPFVRKEIDVDTSLQLRYARNDFTPGPARVLFLCDQCSARECDIFIGDEEFKTEISRLFGEPGRRVQETYRIILANGEPLTEWIHWFAFIQNDPKCSLKAYRLNRPTDTRWKDDVKASMAPPEVCSVFKEGFFDIRTLYASFLDGMHRYTDTIVVCRRNDSGIIDLLESKGFYDSASRGVAARMAGALKELEKQLEEQRLTMPAERYNESVALIEKLQQELETNQNLGQILDFGSETSTVRKGLEALQTLLESSIPQNKRALEIFVFINRLGETWIHSLFKPLHPSPSLPKIND